MADRVIRKITFFSVFFCFFAKMSQNTKQNFSVDNQIFIQKYKNQGNKLKITLFSSVPKKWGIPVHHFTLGFVEAGSPSHPSKIFVETHSNHFTSTQPT